MNVAETVKAAHTGLASGRCFVNAFPQLASPVWPAIRFTVVGRDVDVVIDGTDDGDADDIRVQVDYVDTTYNAAKSLRDSGVTAMLALSTPCVRVGEFETYDTDTKTHRFVVDFLFMPSTVG